MFEEKVLEIASAVMSNRSKIEFVNGSLFVEDCHPRDAVRLETILLNMFPVGIILSRFGNTSAFDFV